MGSLIIPDKTPNYKWLPRPDAKRTLKFNLCGREDNTYQIAVLMISTFFLAYAFVWVREMFGASASLTRIIPDVL